MKKTALTIAILAAFSPVASFANETKAQNTVADLGEIEITVEKTQLNSHPLDKPDQVTNGIVIDDALKTRGTNLGDALSKELGIHANGFGGGASAPIIRGQEGKRIKILQNGSETLDMSAMSPDHAVAVDSILSKQIEIVRGVTPVLYASGNSAGVINVIDQKIPTKQSAKAVTGELGVRVNSADQERLIAGQINANLGQHFVAHLEGLKKDAKDYRTATFYHNGERHRKLDDSFSDSQSVAAGLSWVGDAGYLGVAYSERKDNYGLPAHSHLYEHYDVELIQNSTLFRKGYLKYYPFLIDETDVFYNNPGIKCREGNYGVHHNPHLCGHEGHDHSLDGHDHDSPYIALHTKRYDVRGQWYQPLTGLDQIRLTASQANYRHDEKTGSVVDNAFANQAYNVRLELVHAPIGRLTGVLGVQHLSQKQHALNAHAFNYNRQHLLNDHTATQNSVFLLERLSWDKVQLEFGARAEQQKITMQYNAEVKQEKDLPPAELTAPHKSTAYSYAAGVNWQPNDRHKLSLTVSHQERLPNAQELYAHGKHLATNSFDTGNKNLNKEKSNNIDLGWAFTGDKWDFKAAAYYHHFDNYVYLATLNDPDRRICIPNTDRCIKPNRVLNDTYSLRLNRYYQSKARIYGAEAEVGYHITPNQRISIFGDYVRGQLKDLPALPNALKSDGSVLSWQQQPDGNAPRMPAARVGVRADLGLSENLTMNLETVHSFDQNKVAKLEQPTKGHTMVNAGLSYQGKFGGQSYTAFVNANNIFDAKAYNHASFLPYIPLMGRSVQAGVNWRF